MRVRHRRPLAPQTVTTEEEGMNKQELIDAIADRVDVPKAQAARMVAAFTETVVEALKGGDKVALTGFGTFAVTERAARKGRNPQTGKEIAIEASKTPRFTAGKTFKDRMK
jgi:DNA-binding protein HU-beta